MQAPPIFVNERVFHLWNSASSKEQFKTVTTKMSNVVEASCQRIQAELWDTLQTHMCVFSMKQWHHSQGFSVEEKRTFQDNLKTKLTKLFKACKVDDKRGVAQYFHAVPAIYQLYLSQKQEPGEPQNRTLWRKILEPDFQRHTGDLSELRLALKDIAALINSSLVTVEMCMDRPRRALLEGF